MGYDFHITRAENWGDSEETPTTFAEWSDYVRTDARLIAAGIIAFGQMEPREQPVYVVSHPDAPSIHWYRGDLVVAGAGETDIEQLRPIAESLRARIQGDDGEFY